MTSKKRVIEDSSSENTVGNYRTQKMAKVSCKKYILFPVAVIGCGKTTVGLTLQSLIENGFVQNDELQDSASSFEKACIEELRRKNVVYADRNNHMFRERSSFISSMNSMKDENTEIVFIALNFLSGKQNLAEDKQLVEITNTRVFGRAGNHPSIETESRRGAETAKRVMDGFISRFEPIDTSKEPDSLFDSVIDLEVSQNMGSKANVVTILNALSQKYPELVEEFTEEQVNEAFEKALNHKSSKRKIFSSNGSFVYTIPETNFSGKSVSEADVGITTFTSPSQLAFAGTLKQRYTDFLVNEIGPDDKVIHLTDLGLTKQKKTDSFKEKPKEVKEDEVKDQRLIEIVVAEEQKATLIDLLGPDDFESLMTNVVGKSRKLTTAKKFGDKEQRTNFHQTMRKIFQNKLETSTEPDGAIQITVASKRTRGNNPSNRHQKDKDLYGLGPKKPFLHFVLYKQNKDTMEAVNLIAKFTRINPKNIRYAGTKDRRAVTVQRMCISKGDAGRINTLNQSLRGMTLGGFSYGNEGINLGDLKGNEFVITIRDVKLETETDKSIEQIVSENFSTLKEKGFINYYGMQRFGTFSVSTHEVGKQILLSNWEGAVELLLSNQEFVLPDSVQAREIWQATKNPNYALEFMPKKCLAETCILKSLVEPFNGKGFEGFQSHHYFQAISKIPRNLRIMYGHAYQSYVWNCVASKRVTDFGLEVLVGDLVIDDLKEIAEVEEELEGGEDVKKNQFIRARAVTKGEVEAKKFTIYDVVLPTPGFDILYPEDEKLREVYVEVMKKDGLDPFKMVRNVREFSLAGSYRNVINKPKNLEFYITKYENLSDELVNDDLQILEQCNQFDENYRVKKSKEGSKTAVIVKMSLPTSSYATMALRELMKIDTTRRSQSFSVKQVQ